MQCFDLLSKRKSEKIPPFFIFTKAGKGRDVVFRGLAVPGSDGINPSENLTAIWKTYNGRRFQNYKAIFTILDIPKVSREWISDLNSGSAITSNTPMNFLNWHKAIKYPPLIY